MEQINTKKPLEEKLKVGTVVEIVQLGEITYAGKDRDKLEFINRIDEKTIISFFIDRKKIYIDDFGKLRVKLGLSPEDQEGYQKGIDSFYEIKDEILKKAGR